MTDKNLLESCFTPLDRRVPAKPKFLRIIGWDREGSLIQLLARFYKEAGTYGAYIKGGLPNPSEPEITRFYRTVGENFEPAPQVVARQLTVWLGQLQPSQKQTLHSAVMASLELLRSRGANNHMLKNAYVKFMCWLRGSFGRALNGIGSSVPPKLLLEGDITKYSALILRILHHAGCDVWYVNFTSEDSYKKADPEGRFSELIRGEVLSPPPVHFTALQPSPGGRAPSGTAPDKSTGRHNVPPSRPSGSTAPPRPAVQTNPVVTLNTWMGNHDVWDAIRMPFNHRVSADGKPGILFAAVFGVDERAEYRNRLFKLKKYLEASGRRWELITKDITAPSVKETDPFRMLDKNTEKNLIIYEIAERINCGSAAAKIKGAFVKAMNVSPCQNQARFFNHAVRLACWLQRYAKLFIPGLIGYPPALVYYGPIREAVVALLWTLAQAGVDVLYVSPDKTQKQEFARHYLPHDWLVVELEKSLTCEPFPEREERLRAGTTAYNASRELDRLLYNDTGLYRDHQFTRCQPVTLRTTFDEVWQLWPEEAQFRPSFHAENGTVYVPNLFAKINGVDKGDESLLWERVRGMVSEDVHIITTLPFLAPGNLKISMEQACGLLRGGRLNIPAIKSSRLYKYSYMPDAAQDFILEKIQALLDYCMILNGGSDLPAVTLSVLLELDKELLWKIQNFDFTRAVPKVLIVDVTENVFSLRECILLAFLNLAGFDIVVFTPTGYKNLESHINPDCYDSLTVGKFRFGLTIPNLRARSKGAGSLLGRLFGGG